MPKKVRKVELLFQTCTFFMTSDFDTDSPLSPYYTAYVRALLYTVLYACTEAPEASRQMSTYEELLRVENH